MIQVSCRTNLDLLPNERWPTYLPALPAVGDTVYSGHEHPGGFRLRLVVVGVSFRPDYLGKWVIEIELHTPPPYKTITQFYEWYAPATGNRVSFFI